MIKKIFISGLFHETHTFLAEKTSLVDFRQGGLFVGNEILEANVGNCSPMDGFLSFAAENNWDVVPGIQMTAMPSGTVSDEVVQYFMEYFFKSLADTFHQLDAIYLVLHGAMVSESCMDVEGELLEKLHDFMSSQNRHIPVVAVLDLHANVSPRMCVFSTCLYGYRKNPHTDARDAAIHTAILLRRILNSRSVDVKQIFRASNFIFPPSGLNTAKEPMKSLLEYVQILEEKDPKLLCVNVWAGYAYADIDDCGFSLSCCTTGDEIHGERYLDELMHILNDHLADAYPYEFQLLEALALVDAANVSPWPVLLMEASDNIGGGSPGDATGILAPLLLTGRAGIVVILNDPEAVQKCARSGLNCEIEISIGGKTDEFHGDPIVFKGSVKRLSEGDFELENKNSHLASVAGIHIKMGPCAVIENDYAEILLTTYKTPPMDLGQLHSQGIFPENAQYIIVKAAVSHIQAYAPIAGSSYYIDSPGLCTSNLNRLPYQRAKAKTKALNQ